MIEFDFEAFRESVIIISARYFLLAGATFFIFYVLFKERLGKIKIQKKMPKKSDYWRDIKYSIISIMIFSIFAYTAFILLKDYNFIIYSEVDNYYYLVFNFIWMFFLHDAYFYLIHRIMHLPYFYKKFHLVHHRSTNPSPWTAYAFHPLEAILEAGIVFLIAFSVPVYRKAFYFFMLFQIIYNIYGHLGYELYPRTFRKTRIGRWINTGTAHNLHHKSFYGNYGLYTLIWDRLFGTVRKDYDEI